MLKISFIIVNYATKGLLEENINNLLSIDVDSEIILVDNGSPDGSAQLVEEKFGNNKKVILIKTQNNGFSAGANLAIKQARGKYHIYLGTDAFPSTEAIKNIYDYLENRPDVGIVTPHLYTREGKTDMDAHRGFPTPAVALSHYLKLGKIFKKNKVMNGYTMGYLDINTTHEVDACISHFMAINPKVYEKIGVWDENYFLYGEDIDMCYRVKQAGFKVIYLGGTKVLHYKGVSVGRNTAKDIKNAMNTNFDQVNIGDKTVNKAKVKNTSLWFKVQIARESTKSMRYFYKKHFKQKYNAVLTGIVVLGTYIVENMKVLNILVKSIFHI